MAGFWTGLFIGIVLGSIGGLSVLIALVKLGIDLIQIIGGLL